MSDLMDNYATHNTAEIKTWLARHPRFHVHFTPTGSSGMNQVERWFGLLTDKLIRRGVHTSVQALENDAFSFGSELCGAGRPGAGAGPHLLPGASGGGMSADAAAARPRAARPRNALDRSCRGSP